jgi:hypothetical protein
MASPSTLLQREEVPFELKLIGSGEKYFKGEKEKV